VRTSAERSGSVARDGTRPSRRRGGGRTHQVPSSSTARDRRVRRRACHGRREASGTLQDRLPLYPVRGTDRRAERLRLRAGRKAVRATISGRRRRAHGNTRSIDRTNRVISNGDVGRGGRRRHGRSTTISSVAQARGWSVAEDSKRGRARSTRGRGYTSPPQMAPERFPPGGLHRDYLRFWAVALAIVAAKWFFFRRTRRTATGPHAARDRQPQRDDVVLLHVRRFGEGITALVYDQSDRGA